MIAQGNLQFNQVLLVTSTQTVPSGKVWKVENAIATHLLASCSTDPLHSIVVNGFSATITQGGQVGFDGYCFGWRGLASVTEFPLWLPAGTTLAAGSNVNALSVIEFNIVP